ncbi:MAG TPA: ATP-binding protein, partial [Thermodesulfovibrionales bacterium]|nr:ATP-binding protein [Thermodesulfovibrionales bacterium]
MVDTFHGLVARLKDKERELEVLRKKAEDRADVIETYNEYILQSVPSGVISLDRGLTVTRINAAAERILGVKAGDFIGKSYTELFGDPLQALLRSGAVEGRSETHYTIHSGKDIHIGYSLTPLVDSQKEIIGRLLVFTDLTELKALEAQAELRDRLSSLGEMAAGMAHELRNPMGVIAGYTKLLGKKVEPSSLHIVDSITNEIAVMDRIITDFLSFARPTEPRIATIDLSDIIGKCAGHLETHDVRIFSAVEGVPAIQGDEILLRQAFANLVQNAVEAMPHGGELGIGFVADENAVEVSVSDTGHGVPESIRDRIFLPFYTTKDKGTGLGLAIV